MGQPDLEPELMESRQVVLVLRLTLNQNSHLLYGEVLNAEGVGQGRFINLASMSNIVNRWLERQQDDRSEATDKAS